MQKKILEFCGIHGNKLQPSVFGDASGAIVFVRILKTVFFSKILPIRRLSRHWTSRTNTTVSNAQTENINARCLTFVQCACTRNKYRSRNYINNFESVIFYLIFLYLKNYHSTRRTRVIPSLTPENIKLVLKRQGPLRIAL